MTFFVLQAEDGIRDTSVTGVQTCALPICTPRAGAGSTCSRSRSRALASRRQDEQDEQDENQLQRVVVGRSEERRVGKEGRSRGRWMDGQKKHVTCCVAEMSTASFSHSRMR